MQDSYKIYIDRLKDFHEESISYALDASFLEIDEKELTFSQPIEVKGKAYLTESHLIMHLSAQTTGQMPCSICNKLTNFTLKIENFYLTESLENIVSGIYDFRPALREALLLELPSFVECNNGTCPERKEIAKYLKKSSNDNHTYFPFADLEKGD